MIITVTETYTDKHDLTISGLSMGDVANVHRIFCEGAKTAEDTNMVQKLEVALQSIKVKMITCANCGKEIPLKESIYRHGARYCNCQLGVYDG
jgi:hypothetical protein